MFRNTVIDIEYASAEYNTILDTLRAHVDDSYYIAMVNPEYFILWRGDQEITSGDLADVLARAYGMLHERGLDFDLLDNLEG